ncbi:MAG: 2-oxoglutarate dehydrogenase E1 component [Gemmatimonadota bacterium]|nr:2-oxoglutarate dehydrogenase E1 component [Gemmatimonadota bacterium]
MSSTHFDAQNAAYVQALYEDFTRNPEAVHPEWRKFFERGHKALLEDGLLTVEGDSNGSPAIAVRAPADAPTRVERAAPSAPLPVAAVATPTAPEPATPARPDAHLLSLVARAANLLQAFREHGHQAARIDPLGSEPPGHPQLDPAYFGTTMEELAEIPTSVLLHDGDETPLASTLDRLKATYSGALGYEFEHLEDPGKVAWLWEQVERGTHFARYTDEDRLRTLDRLTQVEGLEQFLHRAYLGQKRFSIEGTDMIVPMLDEAIEIAAADGATEVVVGMAHRGRLNVLTHILGVSYDEILGEFEGRATPGSALWVPDPGTGDVKYHHGATADYTLRSGDSIRITLAPNPSHLEYVNPVILGMARTQQHPDDNGGTDRDTSRVVPVLIHGDAAFAAEGVVAETLNLARLRGYEVGGSIHIIANNQVGFTTNPSDGRSTRYASDLAKGYDIPVIHANGDAPEECLAAVRLAMAYRKRFHDDALIDLVGYRRHGHNEADEPGYTQPTLYTTISDHATPRERWAQSLMDRGLVTGDEVAQGARALSDELRQAQDLRRETPDEEVMLPWTHPDFEAVMQDFDPYTPVPFEKLEKINEALLTVPERFTVHPKLKRQLDRRGKGFGPDFALDWAHAEALAIGSLLQDGIPVRLSGQDCERGTFSHRHLVLNDAVTGARHMPLAQVADTRLEVYNSPLTEAAVIGFEYGVAVAADRDLVLWEAQFGDFVNVAQVMIDQFLSAGWSKWGQRSRLTLLLPHGYEGQGPEHSSARLERFLQLCAEDNMRVVYPTTPTQYFHLIRVQAFSEPERPLIVMSPKSLLRHPMATSPVSELVEGGFERVIDDPALQDWEDAERVRRLILCSGKVYYDLAGSGARAAADTTAIARVEALYPFPDDEIRALDARYPNIEKVVWVQEEPRNMGALTYMLPRLADAMPGSVEIGHVSRPERASPAEGDAGEHRAEQKRIVERALA